jgi:hypothetical protein
LGYGFRCTQLSNDRLEFRLIERAIVVFVGSPELSPRHATPKLLHVERAIMVGFEFIEQGISRLIDLGLVQRPVVICVPFRGAPTFLISLSGHGSSARHVEHCGLGLYFDKFDVALPTSKIKSQVFARLHEICIVVDRRINPGRR